MRRVAALLLLGLAASAHAADEERAFVDVLDERAVHYVQQPIRLRLRFGFEKTFLAERVIPLFRQSLDVPVHVTAPWFDELSGPIVLQQDGEVVTFALNDGAASAVRVGEATRDGRTFSVFSIGRALLPTEAGTIELAAPSLRYAHATRFEDDFINGRVAADRNEVVVTGTPLTLEVRALPEQGRPDSFTGAVGRFTVRASIDRGAVTVGDHLELILVFEGGGNLQSFAVPVLDDLPGFHRYGAIDDRAAPRRTVTYDLAPLSADVVAIPAIAFGFFDPGPPAAYHVVETEPIQLVVHAGTPPPAEQEPVDPVPEKEGDDSDDSERLPVLVLFGALALLAGAAIVLRRSRTAIEHDPQTARADGAADAFRARIGGADTDPGDALAEYVAARMRCLPAAVISPDLAACLISRGIPDDLASRTATLLEDFVAARYGGDPPDDAGLASARAVVDQLESAFATGAGAGRR